MNDPLKQFATDRRTFLADSLATGFALAAGPAAATAIRTDSSGLIAGPVHIPRGDVSLPAYRAQPESASGPLPVVLVIQEIFGVHEYIQDVCRRLAKQGYLAIAPELYFRQGDATKYNDVPTLISELVSKVPDDQVLADLDATAAWAAANHGDANRVAITGFCWGGRITWLYAAHNPKLKAAVAWYGRLVGQPSPNNPRHPIEVVGALKAPVLGLYGGKDQGIPLESVEQMREALKRNRKAGQFYVYDEAGHAFHADYRPSYQAAAAQDGWKEMLTWFKRYGV
ncbi:MAG TPA: dienelactone hydrolase family protein [Chitinolyticbacter sp.]|nr:dienelactone hydrolase family protein [Chitinolyticbacter sp.]